MGDLGYLSFEIDDLSSLVVDHQAILLNCQFQF